MSYKCLKCGHIFDEGESKSSVSPIGELWGRQVYEEYDICPCCGNDEFEKTVECKICGGLFLEDELDNGICSDCLADKKMEYKYDFKGCFNLTKKLNEKESVDINSFLAYMFSESQIEEILLRELVSASAFHPIDCTKFIEEDEFWFCERIIEEVEKNENGKN